MPRLANLSRKLALLSAILFVSGAARAQTTDSATQTELIQKLLQRVDQLEKRVTELEATRPGQAVQTAPAVTSAAVSEAAALPAAATPPAAPVSTAASGHDHGTSMEPVGETSYPTFKLSGFSDIAFSASDKPGTHSGFSEGQFVLHISSALSSRVFYFAELSATARTDAGTGTPEAPGFNFEVERTIIRYDQSDHFKLSFGRYHTPISYWNTEFHHGAWLQTTASRPEMVGFGGDFIPIHFVGAQAEGAFSAGGLNLNYNVGLGNGRSSVLSRAGDWGAVNDKKAWLATVFIKPDFLYGLQLGGSVYRDKIDAIGIPEAYEWIESAHLVWAKEKPEFISEFFNVSHQRPGSSVVTNSQAWYAQVAYRLPMAQLWKPYYRYEYIHVPESDVVFRGLNLDFTGSTLGVRYDVSSFAAFKFEWRNQNIPGVNNINLFWAQTDFTF